MKNVLVVAWKEFRTFFQTPIGYVFLLVFSLLAGWFFFHLGRFLVAGEASMRGLFGFLPWLFMIYAPALTMRAWAEEKKSGTFELLLTMPMRVGETVLGKFLSTVGLIAVSLLCLLPVVFVVGWLGDPDPGPILGAFLGALLLGAAYASIGLAISATTENQIIAFIVSVVICFAFWLLGLAPTTAMFPDAVAGLLHNLSLNTHFASIERGVVDSRDVLYYVTFIGFFLYLNSWIVRRHRPAGVNIVLIAGILVMVNYLGSRTYTRLDLTEEKRFTLSDNTRAILSDLDDDLRLTAFLSSDVPSHFANLRRDIEDTLSEFQSHADGRLVSEVLDPSTSEEANATAETAGIPELSLQGADATSIEAKIARMGILIEYRDKSEVLPAVQSANNLEYELILRIDKVTRTEESKVAIQLNDPFAGMNMPGMGRPPGMGDRHSPQEDLRFVNQVIGSQYETDTVDLKSEVPEEIKSILLVNSEKLDETQQYYLDQYLMRGGNLVVLAEGTQPGNMGNPQMPASPFMRQPIETTVGDFLSHYGIKINRDVVMDRVCGMANVRVGSIGAIPLTKAVPYPPWVRCLASYEVEGVGQVDAIVDHPTTKGIRELMFPFASSIELDPKPGVTKTELVYTSPYAYRQEEEFLMLRPEDFEPEASLDPETFDQQFLIAGILEGAFRSYYTARDLPTDVVASLSEDEESEGGAPAMPDFEGLEIPDPVEITTPMSPEEIPTDGDLDMEVAPNGNGDHEEELDVPGGGLRFQETGHEGHDHEDEAAGEDEAADSEAEDAALAGPDQATLKAELGFRETSPEQTRILVVGSSDFITDQNVQSAQTNLLFMLNAVDFMSSENDLSGVRAKQSVTRPFEEPTESEKYLSLFFGVWFSPLMLLITGLMVYVWRRVWRPARARRAMAAAH